MCREIYKINEYFSIRVVRDLDEFEKLKDTWNCLAEKCDSYTPWLSFDWFNLCSKYFLNGKSLLVLLICKDNDLIAIAPFSVQHEKYKGILKTTKIELIGNVQSPIRNFLFGDSDDKEKKDILSSIFRFFCDVYKDWDIIELDRLPEENNVFDIFKSTVIDTHLKHRTYFCAGNWYLDGIDYSFSQYFQNLPRKYRKEIQRCQRGLRKMGDLRFQMKSDNEDLDHYLDLYDEIRKKSWKAPEKDKIFIREFTKLAAEKGWMRLAFLLCEDVPIASEKWIVCHKTGWIWDGLYDQDYSKYSPGKILSSEISKYVIDHDRVVEIDYMTGDEPYKKYWAPKRRERKGIMIFNNSLRGQSLAFLTTRLLPIIEKNEYFLSAKNKLSAYLKKT